MSARSGVSPQRPLSPEGLDHGIGIRPADAELLGHPGDRFRKRDAELLAHGDDADSLPDVYKRQKTQGIMCQCCLCDCGVMGAYHAYGCEGEIMDYCSPYNLKYDADACIGCGACVERCPMGAITIDDDGKCVMDRQCIRCGQCAYICPAEARKLTAKPANEIRLPADDWKAKELQKARRRMLQLSLIHI